jgi:Raf kinase inhibitor-like YbhB/YbcL family protein
MSIQVTSTAFEHGAAMPKKYTGEGEDVSPPLAWDGVPDETKELVLICDDPDALKRRWVHWVAYGIPAHWTYLPEDAKQGFLQGRNSWPKKGYGGPMPPKGHGVHRYHFTLFALDTELGLEPGRGRDELLSAMSGHILAEGELIGTYERK